MSMKRKLFVIALLMTALATPAVAAPALDPAVAQQARQAVDKGIAYLLAAQHPEGGWQAFDKPHPAITALSVQCLLQQPGFGKDHPAAKRGLAYMLTYVQPDGGIYVDGEGLRNYHTCVALMALAAAKDPAHQEVINNARSFLKKLQWDEEEGYEPSSPWYGGQGYGRGKRPDLSNTQMMVEALAQSGLDSDDPAYRKALAFVSRCQMLGHTNDQPFARGAEDGGFIYSPANDGESKAGTEVIEGRPVLRGYGSMTYAGFKSLLYAGVDRNDERVVKALAWIRKHWTLDHNPNMPGAQSKEGLYYYYHVFARAMAAWGEDVVTDTRGVPHNWREELCRKLVEQQRPDGSWVNETDRWYEGNPDLVTAYAVLALQTALEGQ